MPRLIAALVFVAAVIAGSPSLAQQQEARIVPSGAERIQALRVFLDCNRGCDFDFLRQEIVYVNYVRDRFDAQVHVLVTTERAGAGRRYTLNFIGLESFEGVDQKFTYTSSNTDSDDERRRGFARVFQLGLVRYVLDTPLADGLLVSYRAPQDSPSLAARPEDDPWNFWLYRIGLSGNVNGEERQDSESFFGSINASRVTERWRINVGASGNRRDSNFELEDGSIVRDFSRDYRFGGQLIKSLGPHWGTGIGYQSRRSTFLNLDLSHRLGAAIEYNLFPYSVSSERALTFSYFLGYNWLNYDEPTIFDKISETRPNHGVIVSYAVEQPWGEVDLTLDAGNFLDDFDTFSAELSFGVDYRVFRGLSLNVFGSTESIRNQIYLPRRGATDEEILLRRRALATDSRYRFGLGINYTFGSIYNNVVNSRLNRGRGGFTRFF